MDDVSGPGAPSDDDGGAPRIVRLEEQVAALRAELRAAQERERQLAGALQNRVRNNLAALRSIFSRTVDAGTDLVEVADHFRGRMDAIGRYQLGAGDFALRGFDLDAIVRDELIVFATDQARIDIGGPPVRLNDRTAEALALGVHELATNSIKFGVLGDPGGGGRLSVRWTVHDERLTFVWHETGVSVVAPAPLPYGFGREFIEQGLPYQIGANTSFTLTPGEVRCVIECDLDGQTSSASDESMDRNPILRD